MYVYKNRAEEIQIQVCKELIVHKIIACHYSSIKSLIQKPFFFFFFKKVWFCFPDTPV